MDIETMESLRTIVEYMREAEWKHYNENVLEVLRINEYHFNERGDIED